VQRESVLQRKEEIPEAAGKARYFETLNPQEKEKFEGIQHAVLAILAWCPEPWALVRGGRSWFGCAYDRVLSKLLWFICARHAHSAKYYYRSTSTDNNYTNKILVSNRADPISCYEVARQMY
jgi:hypothetical protein